jgi:deoxyribodipyrimidine photo-lyase
MIKHIIQDNSFGRDISFNKDAQRIEFIWEALSEMKASLNSLSSDITVIHGDPIHAIPLLLKKYDCEALFFNKDYESYANKRDMKIVEHIQQSSADAYQFKDTVLFEEKEILSQADKPYTVFSPYKNNHLAKLYQKGITQYDCENNKRSFAKIKIEKLLSLDSLGFTKTNLSKLAIPTGSSGGRS